MENSVNTGINIANLEEAFRGSEDVLTQMLTLFQVQAAERVQQLTQHLAAWDVMAARTVLHSLVNISGAVRAYGLSDLSKAVGDAIKRDDRERAEQLARALVRESSLVLEQTRLLLEAATENPGEMWSVVLPQTFEPGQ